jgi:hypothetical protein
MGLDQWVGGLEFINYFDIFDGIHSRIFVPALIEAQEFRSMEDAQTISLPIPSFAPK